MPAIKFELKRHRVDWQVYSPTVQKTDKLEHGVHECKAAPGGLQQENDG